MLLTIWCIVVVLGSLWALGLPLVWLFRGRKALAEADYVWAPFVGMAALVVVIQDLVFLDIPIKRATPFVWVAIGLLWVWFAYRGGLRASLRHVPWTLLLAGLLVYLVQGLGLLHAGVRSYVGRAWMDQFNYTSLAQFFVDAPFSTRLEDLGHQPYMIAAMRLKGDRIGQSMLHGFFTSSSGLDAKTLFEPTILLAPALLVFAVFALSFRLGLSKWQSLAAGVSAGLLPGLTQLHLECFMSHALSVPLLMLWPVLLVDLVDQPDWGRFLIGSLIMAATASIYTEIWPLLMGVALFILLLSARKNLQTGRLLAYCGGLAIAPFVLILGFIPTFGHVIIRLDSPVLGHVYPWALQIEGLSRLWVGDLGAVRAQALQTLVRLVTVAVTVLGYWGLIHFSIRPRQPDNQGKARPEYNLRLLALSLVGLVLLPLLVLVKDDRHPYQYYKLLLSISPLLVVGAFLCCRLLPLPGPTVAGLRAAFTRRRLLKAVIPGTLFTMTLAGTSAMTLQSLRHNCVERCSGAFHLRTRDRQELARVLEALHNKPLLIASPDAMSNGWLNAWTAYFARHNQVWVTNRQINDTLPYKVLPEAAETLLLRSLPDRLLVLGGRVPGLHPAPPGEEATPIWANLSYQLWRTNNEHWAIPLTLENPNGIEQGDQTFFWMNQAPTKLVVMAGCPGTVTLRGKFEPGPSRPRTSLRRLRIRTNHGYQCQLTTLGGQESVRIPIPSGKTTLVLKVLDRPTRMPSSRGDQRILLLGAQGLRVHFTPGKSRARPQPRVTVKARLVVR